MRTGKSAGRNGDSGRIGRNSGERGRSKEIAEEVKKEQKGEESKSGVKCPECQKLVRSLGEDSGVCGKCETEIG